MAAPRVSILTAVYDPPRAVFEDTVASVLGQTYDDWEWILTDDHSPAEWVLPRLRELAASDRRVRVKERTENGGIVAASNDSLAGARGEFVALLDHDDVLEAAALATMLEEIDRFDDVDYAYSDQDSMTMAGECHSAYAKPAWSPERFRNHMYTLHLSMLRRELVERVGGFRPGFDGSQDHDLVLRVTEQARRVLHVPVILHHWRQVPGSTAADQTAKPYAWDAGVRAVQDHLGRVGIRGTVRRGKRLGHYTIDREPDPITPVSVVIPTAGTRGAVRGGRTPVAEVIRSVLAHSAHRDVEFVVVHDAGAPAAGDALPSIPGARVRLVEFDEPANVSAMCNVGAVAARGEVLVFLHDDVAAASDGVLERLIAPLAEEGVGLAGPKILGEDLRVRHAGLVYGSGTISRLYDGAEHPDAYGSYGELWMDREVSALASACLAVRADVFGQVGGFNERLPVNYHDVDFSLKVSSLGLRLLWLHDVVLRHLEPESRDDAVAEWERAAMKARWGDFERLPERHANNRRRRRRPGQPPSRPVPTSTG